MGQNGFQCLKTIGQSFHNGTQLLVIKGADEMGHALHLCSLLESQSTRNNLRTKTSDLGKHL